MNIDETFTLDLKFGSYLGSVHKYFGGGAGKVEGAKKVLSYQKGGDQKVFRSKGGVKKV